MMYSSGSYDLITMQVIIVFATS